MSKWYPLGKWVEPALAAEVWLEYGKIAQQFFKGKLDGHILYINGYFFLSQHDVDIIQRESYYASKSHNDAFFKKMLITIKQVTEDLKAASQNISSVTEFLEQYKTLTGVWMPLNIVAEGVEKYVQETDSKAFQLTKGLTQEKPWTLKQVDEMRLLKEKIGIIPKDESSIPKEFKEVLKEHVKKYEWLGTHHFTINKLTVKKLLERMRKDKIETISDKKISGEVAYLVKLLDIMGFIRFRCAETSGYTTFYLYPHLSLLAEQHKISYGEIVEHTIKEISSGTISQEIAEKRKKNTGFLFDGQEHILTNDEIAKYSNELITLDAEDKNEIKGLVACKGYAKGEVRIVTCQEEMKGFKEGMILVAYETTPDIVIAMEKASAIVTDFGGMTSHAAIVSRELGIPCVIGTKIATRMFKDGDYVEVDADKGVVRKITKKEFKKWIKELERKEAGAEVSRIPSEQLELEIAPDLIAWFKSVNMQDLPLVGGKGANLGEMFGEFPIPNGFCITVNAYREFLKQNKLEDKIFPSLKKLDIEKTEELDKESKRVRDLILGSEMPEAVKKEIVENYKKLKEKFVAVRSSATAEDLPTASFAGQQDTYLNVKGEEDLLDCVRKCWASLFTSRAIYYRVINKFLHEKVLICVVVQEMIDSVKAGVMFTVNPVTEDRNEQIIEGSFGLGEVVVSGQVTPDSYTVQKKPFEIKEVTVNEKSIAIVKDKEKGHSKKIELDNKKANSQCLTEDEIKALAELGIKIEKHYGKPQDIEWAVGPDKKVYILQSRPITTL